MSGNADAIFSDGTFEFEGVAPGLHRVVSVDNAERSPSLKEPALGAEVVVGNQEIQGIELHELGLLPEGIDGPSPAGSAGDHLVGTQLPLLSIRGIVVDRTTRQPFNSGRVEVKGYPGGFALDAAGRFEIPKVFRGRWSLIRFYRRGTGDQKQV